MTLHPTTTTTMTAITTTITRLEAILGNMDTTTTHAVHVLIKNLWNCTLEEEMTGFFTTMIYQIVRPTDASMSFPLLREAMDILVEERTRDLDNQRKAREEHIAAIRSRNAVAALKN